MGQGLRFDLFGIPIRIDPSFFVISLFIGFGLNSIPLLVTWVVIVTVSVLLHELGHAVTLRAFDRQPTITLQWLGGVTAAQPVSPARQLVVSLSGPFTALLLLGVPALLIAQGTPDDGSTWAFILREVGWVNIVWSLFNLVPVLPLDGGNFTASALQLAIGNRAYRYTHAISVVIALAAGVAALLYGPEFIFVALFAGFLAMYNFKALQTARPEEERNDLMDGYRAIARNDPQAATGLAERIIQSGPDDGMLAAALEMAAWSRLASADVAGARNALTRLPAGTSANPFLLGAIGLGERNFDYALDSLVSGFRMVQFGPWSSMAAASVAQAGMTRELVDRLLRDDRVGVGALVHFQTHMHLAGYPAEAALIGEAAFDHSPPQPGQTAFNVACDLALSGQSDVAMAWLERAVSLGFATRKMISDDPDLTSLRASGRYADLMARMPAG